MFNTVLMVCVGLLFVVAIALEVYRLYYNYPRIKEGVVVLKIRQNERNWINYKAMAAGRSLYVAPYVHIDNEDWILVLTNKHGREGKLYVSQEDYEKAKIGDVYTKKTEDRFVDRIDYRAASIEDFKSIPTIEPEEQDPLG